MTIAVDMGRKATKTKKQKNFFLCVSSEGPGKTALSDMQACLSCHWLPACTDPGISVRGVQAHLTEKSSGNIFFSPQLILQFYRGGPMVYFKENYTF